MNEAEAIQKGLTLADRSEICVLGTIDAEGYPNMRAMIKMENEGLKTIWFSTNTSSRKIGQLKSNPRASVYFIDFEKWMGLMLVGTVEILQDPQSRKRLWREGYERYYPQGVEDPDYTVLRFTTLWGRYYHALSHATFEVP